MSEKSSENDVGESKVVQVDGGAVYITSTTVLIKIGGACRRMGGMVSG